jgi:hypothetical protein
VLVDLLVTFWLGWRQDASQTVLGWWWVAGWSVVDPCGLVLDVWSIGGRIMRGGGNMVEAQCQQAVNTEGARWFQDRHRGTIKC